MKAEVGCPIVIERRGDSLQWTRIHLPVPQIVSPFTGVKTIEQATYLCTLAWRSHCGLAGWLYAYDGPIRSERISFCTVCVAEANRLASQEFRARRRTNRDRAPALDAELVGLVEERVAA